MLTAVPNKHTLLSLLKANSHQIKSLGESKLSIFGSFITGRFDADSDVDFLVEFDPEQKRYWATYFKASRSLLPSNIELNYSSVLQKKFPLSCIQLKVNIRKLSLMTRCCGHHQEP